MTVRLSQLVITATAAAALTGCIRAAYNLPPAERLMHPGPGVGGPGPGVIPPAPGAGPGAGGVVPANYIGEGGAGCNSCAPGAVGGATSQIHFLGDEGLQVHWDVSGQGSFDSSPVFVPSKQNFPQGAIYRLKLSNLPGRPGVALYPTLEVGPVTPRTDAYLAHSPIPIQFTEEDFDQVLSGNFVTKVVYLPDPEFQELALAGVETLVSTRLDPGVDPISEADRRGSIMAILRIGNKDLEPRQIYEGAGVIPAGFNAPMDPAKRDGKVHGASHMEGTAMPQGAPTAGFAPTAMPPGAVIGAPGPQWGMPITGTPIGLPGPPHVPLGSPAGLVQHKMKNRTRVLLPPPTRKVHVSVKQRPGMNYPRPVNNVKIDETHRATLFHKHRAPLFHRFKQMCGLCD